MTSRDRLRRPPASAIRRHAGWVALAAALAAGLIALASIVSAGILLRHHARLGAEPQLLMPAFLDAMPMLDAPYASQAAQALPVPLHPEKLHDFA
jgi:hypothetical protein